MTIDRAAADKLLTTTRSVRKRLDLTRPVPDSVITECIEVALQAPTGSNRQTWGFVVVTDADKRRALGDMYRRGGDMLMSSGYANAVQYADDDPRAGAMPRVMDSAMYLFAHLGEVPVHVVPIVQGRPEAMVAAQAGLWGSILPAAWSFMLAARARGLGSAWTTIHLFFEKEANALLGIPDGWTQAALLPVAYYTGDDFRPASRLPAAAVTHWDAFGNTRA